MGQDHGDRRRMHPGTRTTGHQDEASRNRLGGSLAGCLQRGYLHPRRSGHVSGNRHGHADQVAGEYLANLQTFAPISREFEGAQLLAWPAPPGQPALLTIDYGGHDNVVVTALNPDGSQQELLVGATGPYAGTTLAGLFGSPATLRIEAGGRGSIEFRPILTGRPWNGSGGISGRGDDVLRLDPLPGGPLTATVRTRPPRRLRSLRLRRRRVCCWSMRPAPLPAQSRSRTGASSSAFTRRAHGQSRLDKTRTPRDGAARPRYP
jgi:hypothetical protein